MNLPPLWSKLENRPARLDFTVRPTDGCRAAKNASAGENPAVGQFCRPRRSAADRSAAREPVSPLRPGIRAFPAGNGPQTGVPRLLARVTSARACTSLGPIPIYGPPPDRSRWRDRLFPRVLPRPGTSTTAAVPAAADISAGARLRAVDPRSTATTATTAALLRGRPSAAGSTTAAGVPGDASRGEGAAAETTTSP